MKSSQHQPENRSSELKAATLHTFQSIWNPHRISQYNHAQKKLPVREERKVERLVTRTKSGRAIKKPKMFEPDTGSSFSRKEHHPDSASSIEKRPILSPKETTADKLPVSVDTPKSAMTISRLGLQGTGTGLTLKSNKTDKMRVTGSRVADSNQHIDNLVMDHYYQDFQVAGLMGKAPCSLYCPEQYGSLPTLPCVKCFCLFHPQCVRLITCPTIYMCPSCTAQSKLGAWKDMPHVEAKEVDTRFGDTLSDDHCYSLSIKCKDKR